MTTRRTRRARAAWIGSGLALAAAGCAVLSLGGGRGELAFSHRQHVASEALDCVICHDEAYTADEPGMPAPDTCMLCHEELDAEKPEKRRVAALFDGEVFRAGHHAALADELVFSHAAHVAAELACAECHRGIETNERLDGAIGVDMPACVACHEQRGRPAECSTCHTEVGAGWRPPSHDHLWERAHGTASRSCERGSSSDCAQCHDERDCADCHLAQPPDSHTNVFRRRTHGFAAMLDRDTCATCHRSDSCETCHASTRPISHVGSWGGTRSRHCLGCHLPVRGNSCIVCHKGAPSHFTAAPKPDWHDPAMNCRQCHGISAPLPHLDNGDDCNACHL